MIGIKGQYLVSIKIGPISDAIKEADLKELKVIEEAGNQLPTMELIYESYSDETFPYLNEGNIVTISIGRTLDDLQDCEFIIIHPERARLSALKHTIRLVGIHKAFPYVSIRKVLTTAKMSAPNAITQVASTYFTPDIQASSTENVNWIQPNTTDQVMVNHLWLQCNISGSFPLLTISLDGYLKLRDANKVFSQKPQWKFSPKAKEGDPTEIAYDGNPQIISQSGALNHLFGHTKQKSIRDTITGVVKSITSDPVPPLLSMASSHNRSNLITSRQENHGEVDSDNQDTEHWETNLRNIQSLATFSSNKIALSISNAFHKIKTLDTGMVKEDEPNSPSQTSAESISGKYVISRVAYLVAYRMFNMHVELCRESFNQAQGNIK